MALVHGGWWSPTHDAFLLFLSFLHSWPAAWLSSFASLNTRDDIFRNTADAAGSKADGIIHCSAATTGTPPLPALQLVPAL